MTEKRRCVVTGASSGIGAATVRRLTDEGWSVLAVARREARLRELSAQTGCDILAADVTSPEDVARIAEAAGPADALVNNAGGAIGLESVAEADEQAWRTMFDVNVMGTLAVTKALLPALRERGGDVLVLTSTAAHVSYEGGAGYCAAKHAERALADALRLELCGEPVRVIQIAPGMVATEEFSLNRFRGDQAKADAVYAGVRNPLSADDVADAICWTLTRPAHVNIDLLMIRPLAQAAQHKLARGDA